MIKARSLLIFILFLEGAKASAVPSWVKVEKSQGKIGNTYRVICNARGPSLEIARREALESCQSSAADQMSVDIEINSIVIESENDVALHHSVKLQNTFKGLSCNPKNESIEDESLGSVVVWLQCEFNLSKVKLTEQVDKIKPVNKSPTRSVAQVAPEQIRYLNDRIVISSVPACESILIKSKSARIIRCTQNPMAVVLDSSDESLIIRAPGYMPQTILLDSDVKEKKTIEVYLDKN